MSDALSVRDRAEPPLPLVTLETLLAGGKTGVDGILEADIMRDRLTGACCRTLGKLRLGDGLTVLFRAIAPHDVQQNCGSACTCTGMHQSILKTAIISSHVIHEEHVAVTCYNSSADIQKIVRLNSHFQ